MTEPLVSVKMITYNHAPFIARAIEGVLQQKTNFPFEVVIGEDCSTDGTREIVFEYQKKYPEIIRVVTSDKNVGMKKNSLRVFRACRGKYIAFCEGDDYWHHPLKLQKQTNYLENHPECGLVHSSYDVYLIELKKLIKDYIKYKKWQVPENPCISDFVEKREMSHVILTLTVMIRRHLYEQIIESDPYLHQDDFFLMGDTQLWAEVTTRARTHYIPESLATYSITDESASRSKDIKRTLRFYIGCSDLFIYLSNKYNLPASMRNEHEANRLEYMLRLAFYTRDVALANAARQEKKNFTWKEWVRYYGARNLVIYYVYRTASLFLDLFRNRRNPWL